MVESIKLARLKMMTTFFVAWMYVMICFIFNNVKEMTAYQQQNKLKLTKHASSLILNKYHHHDPYFHQRTTKLAAKNIASSSGKGK